ncbi:thioredoxin family protein [Longirhabdus pacifica]|uniref:thioredoxin family protein n=1 Tax=Longirhabdus pacifica TaxID=2305227 RepID=UPI0013E8CEB1|nr:thioredoxin family protein [Longirhabdus pacifica]
MKIMKVKEEHIESLVNKYDHVLLAILKPTCDHCVQMKKAIKELNEELKPNIVFAYLEIKKKTPYTRKMNAINFPTIILYDRGEPIRKWVGERPKRQLASIIQYYC